MLQVAHPVYWYRDVLIIPMLQIFRPPSEVVLFRANYIFVCCRTYLHEWMQEGAIMYFIQYKYCSRRENVVGMLG